MNIFGKIGPNHSSPPPFFKNISKKCQKKESSGQNFEVLVLQDKSFFIGGCIICDKKVRYNSDFLNLI